MKTSELVDTYFNTHSAIVKKFGVGRYYLDDTYRGKYWLRIPHHGCKDRSLDKIFIFDSNMLDEDPSHDDWFDAGRFKEKGDIALAESWTGAHLGDEYYYHVLDMDKKITDKKVIAYFEEKVEAD